MTPSLLAAPLARAHPAVSQSAGDGRGDDVRPGWNDRATT